MRSTATLIVLLAAALGASAVHAQSAGPAGPLEITVTNLTLETARAMGLRTDEAATGRLRSDDVLEYRLQFTNQSQTAVQDVVFDDPIPVGLAYAPQSAGATGDMVEILFSIDGGVTYSARPMVTVLEDGEEVQRPAPADRYTHIRWRVGDALQPGEQVQAWFHAQMRTPPQSARADSGAGLR